MHKPVYLLIYVVLLPLVLAVVPSTAQIGTDNCADAVGIALETNLEGIVTLDICSEQSLEGKLPESAPRACNEHLGPTTWIKYTIDDYANQFYISISDLDGSWVPSFAVYGGDDCDDLSLIGGCSSSNGYSAAVNRYTMAAGGNGAIWVAVTTSTDTSAISDPGFTICVSSVIQLIDCISGPPPDYEPTCNPVAGFNVVWRSEDPDGVRGLAIEGPYLPGETIRVCIDFFYDASITDADWLHGLIPFFDNGFDREGFDPSSLSYAGLGALPTWYPSGTVTTRKSLPDICVYTDTDGAMLLCNNFCNGCPCATPIAAGTALPGGWYWNTSGMGGDCDGGTTSPNTSWGIGQNVANIEDFCFDLKLREFSSFAALQQASFTVGFQTMSHSATGCWNDPLAECLLDVGQINNSLVQVAQWWQDCDDSPQRLQEVEAHFVLPHIDRAIDGLSLQDPDTARLTMVKDAEYYAIDACTFFGVESIGFFDNQERVTYYRDTVLDALQIPFIPANLLDGSPNVLRSSGRTIVPPGVVEDVDYATLFAYHYSNAYLDYLDQELDAAVSSTKYRVVQSQNTSSAYHIDGKTISMGLDATSGVDYTGADLYWVVIANLDYQYGVSQMIDLQVPRASSHMSRGLADYLAAAYLRRKGIVSDRLTALAIDPVAQQVLADKQQYSDVTEADIRASMISIFTAISLELDEQGHNVEQWALSCLQRGDLFDVTGNFNYEQEVAVRMYLQALEGGLFDDADLRVIFCSFSDFFAGVDFEALAADESQVSDRFGEEPRQVWIKDSDETSAAGLSTADIGREPNEQTAEFWLSPSIWNNNSPILTYTDEQVINGATSYLRVRLDYLCLAPPSGLVEIYRSVTRGQYTWPETWIDNGVTYTDGAGMDQTIVLGDLLGTIDISQPTLVTDSTLILTLEMETPPDSAYWPHPDIEDGTVFSYAYLAIARVAGDALYAEPSRMLDFVLSNNDAALKQQGNIVAIDSIDGRRSSSHVILLSDYIDGSQSATQVMDILGQVDQLQGAGQVLALPGESLLDAWSGADLQGLSANTDGSYAVTGTSFSVRDIVLDDQALYPLYLYYESDQTMSTADLAVAFAVDGLNSGGVRYSLRGSDTDVSSGEIASYHLSIYPNPATQTITVEHDGGIAEAEIRDLSGRLITELEGAGAELLTIDVNHIAPGIYLLTVEDRDGKRYTDRMIILQR